MYSEMIFCMSVNKVETLQILSYTKVIVAVET